MLEYVDEKSRDQIAINPAFVATVEPNRGFGGQERGVKILMSTGREIIVCGTHDLIWREIRLAQLGVDPRADGAPLNISTE